MQAIMRNIANVAAILFGLTAAVAAGIMIAS